LLEKSRRMRPHSGYRIIDGHVTVVRSWEQ